MGRAVVVASRGTPSGDECRKRGMRAGRHSVARRGCSTARARPGRRKRSSPMADEDEVLRAARGAPVRERCAHGHWKARVQCYDDVRELCARARAMADESDLVAFGACARASERDAGDAGGREGDLKD